MAVKGLTTPLSRWLQGSYLFVQVLGTCMLPPTGLIPWFSKTEGNTYATLLHHPFLFKGKPMHAQEVARRISRAVAGDIRAKSSQDFTPDNEPFLAPLPGSLCTSQDIPSTHHKLLSLALHYLPFASRFPLPHFTLAVLFTLFFPFASFSLSSCGICCHYV